MAWIMDRGVPAADRRSPGIAAQSNVFAPISGLRDLAMAKHRQWVLFDFATSFAPSGIALICPCAWGDVAAHWSVRGFVAHRRCDFG